MKTFIRKLVLLVMVTIIALPFSLLNNALVADETHPKVGVVTGTVFGDVVLKDNPNAQIEYYNATSDLPIALESGKIEAYALDEPVARMLCNIYTDQTISKKLSFEDYGIIVNKQRNDLLDQLNEYITILEDTGELFDLQEKWLNNLDKIKTIDFDSIKYNKPVLNLAISSNLEPFVYIKDGEYAGYEIDLIVSFCKQYGYGLQIEDSNFTGVLASVASGNSDLGSCVATITEERKATMNFTIPTYQGGTVYVKKKRVVAESINSLDDLSGKNIAVQNGAVYDTYIKDAIDSPKMEYYNLYSDMFSALDSNKVSALAIDRPVIETYMNERVGRYKILDSVKHVAYGIAFPKNDNANEQLRNEINEFIAKINSNGTSDEVYNIWTGSDESKKVIDRDDLTGENGTIIFGVSSSVGAPFPYLKDDELVGWEIDLIYRFCKEYGYDVQVNDYSIDGLFTAIESGEVDLGASGLSITNERKEKAYYSDPYYQSDCVLVAIENQNAQTTSNEDKGFFEGIKDSFEKTFIKEDRWKLFLSGILTTLFVTLASIVLGTIFGFVLYMLQRNSKSSVNAFGRLIDDIITKTPIVILLMVLYYIVFSHLGINGTVVAIIGLTIIFANVVKGLLVMGVNSIDKGQLDAALALGYTKNKAFTRMVLPQAIINVMSGYKNAIISLIKDSSVVGYIAVQDLTKVSDIIRSRTYEAFFPLITTGIIYYLLATLLIFLVKKIEIKIGYKRKN